MTNIEKIKRILDAGHWVKVSYGEFHDDVIVTSYTAEWFSYTTCGIMYTCSHNNTNYDNCTIEVIQRIPTPYKPGDKVLVLSNPNPGIKEKEDTVWKVLKVNSYHNGYYRVWDNNQTDWFHFPHHCLSPAFDDEEISDTNRIISGKEVTVTIDGKEYTCVIK